MSRDTVPAYNPLESLVLDRDSPVPLYFQLAQHLESDIRSGTLKSGDRLENEVKIAEYLGLSRPTVRAAFRYLVERELVLRRQGQGTVVTAEKVNRPVKLSSLFDDLASTGKRPATKVLHNELVKASDLVKEALGLGDDRFVTYLERLRFGDDEPIALDAQLLPLVARHLQLGTARRARLLRTPSRERGLPGARRAANLRQERFEPGGALPQ